METYHGSFPETIHASYAAAFVAAALSVPLNGSLAWRTRRTAGRFAHCWRRGASRFGARQVLRTRRQGEGQDRRYANGLRDHGRQEDGWDIPQSMGQTEAAFGHAPAHARSQ